MKMTVQTKTPVTDNLLYLAIAMRTQKGLPNPTEHGLEVVGWHHSENTYIYTYRGFRLWFRSVVSHNWLAIFPGRNIRLVFSKDMPMLGMIKAMNRELE